jgi:hypothetical protein
MAAPAAEQSFIARRRQTVLDPKATVANGRFPEI